MKDGAEDRLKRCLAESQKILFFGGAGVSTESGIPDFRSNQGLYQVSKHENPEWLLSIDCLMQAPSRFFDFYKNNMIYPWAKPNKAHLILQKLEAQGKLLGVITQNIDGLHQLAGAQNVVELHGSVHRNYCMKCGAFYDLKTMMGQSGVPHCKECDGIVRPDVVLYGEGLSSAGIEKAIAWIEEADLLIVAGTSLQVYPAAGLIGYFKGAHLAYINKEITIVPKSADILIEKGLGEVLSYAIGAAFNEDF